MRGAGRASRPGCPPRRAAQLAACRSGSHRQNDDDGVRLQWARSQPTLRNARQYVAERRGRPTENRWIGQRIDDPPVDLASLARSQGVVGYGPASTAEELASVTARAVAEVRAGAPVVIDALIGTDPGPPKILLSKR